MVNYILKSYKNFQNFNQLKELRATMLLTKNSWTSYLKHMTTIVNVSFKDIIQSTFAKFDNTHAIFGCFKGMSLH